MDTYLKIFREKALSMTQKEFADRLGVSQNTVSRWESDPDSLTMKQLSDISTEFQVEVGDIISPKSNVDSSYEAWRPNSKDWLNIKDRMINLENEKEIVDGIINGEEYKAFSRYREFGERKIQVLNRIMEEGSKPSIAVTGPSDSGKSTFINVMLGEAILDANWTPTTSTGIKIVHVLEKPTFMNGDNTVVFATPIDEPLIQTHLLSNEEYFTKYFVKSGSRQLINDFGTHNGDSFKNIRGEREKIYTIVSYLDAPILEQCEIWDIPGTDANDDEDLSDDFVAVASIQGADILIHVTPSTALLHSGQITQLKEDIKRLARIDTFDDRFVPFENLFIVASQANFVLNNPENNDLMKYLENRIDSIRFSDDYWANLTDKAVSSTNRKKTRYSKKDIQNRKFMFERYDKHVQSDFKESLLNLLDKISKFKLKHLDELEQKLKKEYDSSLSNEIRELENILIDQEKAEKDYDKFEKMKPTYIQQNKAMVKLIKENAKHFRISTYNEIKNYFDKEIQIDSIRKLIDEKNYGKSKEGKEQFISWFQDSLGTNVERILTEKSEEYARKINDQLEEFEQTNQNIKISNFNYSATFLGVLSSVATIGAFAFYFSTLGNLGGYILLSQAVSLLAGMGISVGGTATAASAIAAIGGPMTIVIAIAVVVGVLVRIIAGGSWQKTFAKNIYKQLNKPFKNSEEPQYDNMTYQQVTLEKVNKYWVDTEEAVNEEMFNDNIKKQEKVLKERVQQNPKQIKKLLIGMRRLLFNAKNN